MPLKNKQNKNNLVEPVHIAYGKYDYLRCIMQYANYIVNT